MSSKSNTFADVDGRLRLMGGRSGPGFEYGRLEIFVRGFWSTVCDERSFTPAAAQVACRALGYDGGAAILGVTDVEVNCEGNETSLLDCTSSEDISLRGECSIDVRRSADESDRTDHDTTVLACSETSTECKLSPVADQGALRLIGGSGTLCDPLHSGIVEIFNDGDWGAICPGSIDSSDPIASVVCRQLGFRQGSIVNSISTVPTLMPAFDRLLEEAEAPIDIVWLGHFGFECQGSEQMLSECDLDGGFLPRSEADFGACSGAPRERLHVACTQFAVT